MIEILKMVPLFQQLDEQQLEQILTLCRKKSYKAQTVLFREREPGSCFYILLTGSVKIYTANASGGEKILSIIQPGENFGELSLIDGQPRSASAETIINSTLLTLSADHFMELMRSNFEIARTVMRELCSRLRKTNQHVYDLTFLDARTRVIKNFIAMTNKQGIREGNKVFIKIDLDYDELAQMSGVTKQVLMQLLRDLQELGILTINGNDFILALDKLHRTGSA